MTLSQFRVLSILFLLLIRPPVGFVYEASWSEFMTFPLGPFLFFDVNNVGSCVKFFEYLYCISCVLILFGVFKRPASLALFTSKMIIGAVLFSTGKVDHDLILFFPFLGLGIWGWSKSGLVKAQALAFFALVFFFTSSGLIKGLSGWLDLSQPSATYGLFVNYLSIYGNPPNSSILYLLSNPVISKGLDLLTVFFESGALLLLFWSKKIYLYLFCAVFFHLAVFYSFGIDFSKLIVFYTFFLVSHDSRLGIACTPERLSPRANPTFAVLAVLFLLIWFLNNDFVHSLKDLSSRLPTLTIFLSFIMVLVASFFKLSKRSSNSSEFVYHGDKVILFYDGDSVMCRKIALFFSKCIKVDLICYSLTKGEAFAKVFPNQAEFQCRRRPHLVLASPSGVAEGPYAVLSLLARSQFWYVGSMVTSVVPPVFVWGFYNVMSKYDGEIYKDSGGRPFVPVQMPNYHGESH